MAENEQKKSVISGKAEVKTKKKTFKDVLFKEDFKSVAKFSLNEILIPSFKKLVHDLITGGADMLMYGTKGAPTKKSSLSSKISYLGYYDDPKPVQKKKKSNNGTKYPTIRMVMLNLSKMLCCSI